MSAQSELLKCFAHAVDPALCNGPHRYVRTSVDLELLSPGEKPVGIPFDQPDSVAALAVLDTLWTLLNPITPNPRTADREG